MTLTILENRQNLHTLIDILEDNYRCQGIDNKSKMFLYHLINALREEHTRIYLNEIRIKQEDDQLKVL